MLQNLMAAIQEYVLLNDDNKEEGRLKYLQLVHGTARLREENRICIWVQDHFSSAR